MPNMPAIRVIETSGPPSIINPQTSEVYNVTDAPDALLARTVDDLKAVQTQAREARSIVESELIQRLVKARERSLRAGSFLAERGEKREWDVDATWAALGELVTAGLVSSQEADEAMPEVTIRRPDGRRLNALLGRLVGEDPVAASPLAKARGSRVFVKVQRVAVDSTASEI